MKISLNTYSHTPKMQQAKNHTPSFTGIGRAINKADVVVEKGFAPLVELIAKSRFMRWATEKGSKVEKDKAGKIISSNYQKLVDWMPPIAGMWGTLWYITHTLKNKDIEKERKLPLTINMAAVALFSLVATRGIQKKLLDPLERCFLKSIKGLKDEAKLKNGWRISVPMFAKTIAFRFLGPVLAVPIADKMSKMIRKKEGQ